MMKLKTILYLAFLAFLAPAAKAQIYIGAAAGAVDSAPSPNASVYGFLGYVNDFGSWGIKTTGGYYFTLIDEPPGKPKTRFSGFIATLCPEFVLTEDRDHPFKANVGPAVFYGDYYYGDKEVLFGVSPGISWGFGAGYSRFELVGNLYFLFADNMEGSASGPLHLMAQMGILMKAW